MSMDDETCSSSTRYSRPVGYPSSLDDDQLPPTTSSHNNNPDSYMIRWKSSSGKNVDQKQLNLLQYYFQELYVKRNDFFKKIFPGNLYVQFVEVFNRIGAVFSNNQNQTKYDQQTVQKRSLSFGSSTETRLDWFKVKTPDVIVAQPAPTTAGVVTE